MRQLAELESVSAGVVTILEPAEELVRKAKSILAANPRGHAF